MSNRELPVKGSTERRVPDDYDVVFNGEIVGRDPDANVRLEILKTAQAGGGGAAD